MARGIIRVGTSGYVYPHWKEIFYPRGLAASKWLDHYVAHFRTVELNVSFYRLPTPQMFETWRARTPEDFRFAVKGWRVITHRRYLRNCEEEVGVFFENASELGEKLGVVLWQLPPQWKMDLERLEGFLKLLGSVSKARQVVEFRNPTWHVSEVYRLLSTHHVGLCLHDSPRAPIDGVITSDFLYVRRHGAPGRNFYSPEEMSHLAGQLNGWAADGRDVYLYFNNDWQGAALQNAREVLDRLNGV